MSADRQFVFSGNFALASDGEQWIIQRSTRLNGGVAWKSLSFVRSSKDVLARCLREKGATEPDVALLLADLPPTFDEWRRAAATGRFGSFSWPPSACAGLDETNRSLGC